MKRPTLPQPLQVWLPFIDPLLSSHEAASDLERAQRLWEDEGVVWLIPGLQQPKRWKSPFGYHRELAVPAETLNRLDVFHIGRNGYIVGCDWRRRFVKPSIDSLVPDWLNAVSSGIELLKAPDRTPFVMPFFADPDLVCYGEVPLVFAVGGTTVVHPTQEPGVVRCDWPPHGYDRNLLSVSPARESRAHYGHFPQGRNHLIDRWPRAVANIFPWGGGLDAYKALAEMRRIAKYSDEDPEGARREAAAMTQRWQGSGNARRFESWWLPQLAERGVRDALWAFEELDSLEDAARSEKFQEAVADRRPITTCHGALGLIWTLFSHWLSAGAKVTQCELCGRLLSAKRSTKRFCSKQENPSCFRKRRAADESRRRAGRQQR